MIVRMVSGEPLPLSQEDQEQMETMAQEYLPHILEGLANLAQDAKSNTKLQNQESDIGMVNPEYNVQMTKDDINSLLKSQALKISEDTKSRRLRQLKRYRIKKNPQEYPNEKPNTQDYDDDDNKYPEPENASNLAHKHEQQETEEDEENLEPQNSNKSKPKRQKFYDDGNTAKDQKLSANKPRKQKIEVDDEYGAYENVPESKSKKHKKDNDDNHAKHQNVPLKKKNKYDKHPETQNMPMPKQKKHKLYDDESNSKLQNEPEIKPKKQILEDDDEYSQSENAPASKQISENEKNDKFEDDNDNPEPENVPVPNQERQNLKSDQYFEEIKIKSKKTKDSYEDYEAPPKDYDIYATDEDAKQKTQKNQKQQFDFAEETLGGKSEDDWKPIEIHKNAKKQKRHPKYKDNQGQVVDEAKVPQRPKRKQVKNKRSENKRNIQRRSQIQINNIKKTPKQTFVAKDYDDEQPRKNYKIKHLKQANKTKNSAVKQIEERKTKREQGRPKKHTVYMELTDGSEDDDTSYTTQNIKHKKPKSRQKSERKPQPHEERKVKKEQGRHKKQPTEPTDVYNDDDSTYTTHDIRQKNSKSRQKSKRKPQPEETNEESQNEERKVKKGQGRHKKQTDYTEPTDVYDDDVTTQTTPGIVEIWGENLGSGDEDDDPGLWKKKNTELPKRDVFTIYTPDYYHKQPKVAEKHDFNEPLPEDDRLPEDTKNWYKYQVGREDDQVNGKVKIKD